ncbi:hypothetical protein FKP32DRAFT_1594855 [Trametes sanguinea]|nr:hypothetical protein FKP32DRAFT_1594855 [Trametes sanguinea]
MSSEPLRYSCPPAPQPRVIPLPPLTPTGPAHPVREPQASVIRARKAQTVVRASEKHSTTGRANDKRPAGRARVERKMRPVRKANRAGFFGFLSRLWGGDGTIQEDYEMYDEF